MFGLGGGSKSDKPKLGGFGLPSFGDAKSNIDQNLGKAADGLKDTGKKIENFLFGRHSQSSEKPSGGTKLPNLSFANSNSSNTSNFSFGKAKENLDRDFGKAKETVAQTLGKTADNLKDTGKKIENFFFGRHSQSSEKLSGVSKNFSASNTTSISFGKQNVTQSGNLSGSLNSPIFSPGNPELNTGNVTDQNAGNSGDPKRPEGRNLSGTIDQATGKPTETTDPNAGTSKSITEQNSGNALDPKLPQASNLPGIIHQTTGKPTGTTDSNAGIFKSTTEQNSGNFMDSKIPQASNLPELIDQTTGKATEITEQSSGKSMNPNGLARKIADQITGKPTGNTDLDAESSRNTTAINFGKSIDPKDPATKIVDPNTGNTTGTTDPNAGTSKNTTEENSGKSMDPEDSAKKIVDPNTENTSGTTDPHAETSEKATEPNSVKPTETIDPKIPSNGKKNTTIRNKETMTSPISRYNVATSIPKNIVEAPVTAHERATLHEEIDGGDENSPEIDDIIYSNEISGLTSDTNTSISEISTKESKKKPASIPPYFLRTDPTSTVEQFVPELPVTAFDPPKRPKNVTASKPAVLPPRFGGYDNYNLTGIGAFYPTGNSTGNSTLGITSGTEGTMTLDAVGYSALGVGGVAVASIAAFFYRKFRNIRISNSSSDGENSGNRPNGGDAEVANSSGSKQQKSKILNTTNMDDGKTATILQQEIQRADSTGAVETINVEIMQKSAPTASDETAQVIEIINEKQTYQLKSAPIEKPPRKSKTMHENEKITEKTASSQHSLKTVGEALGGILKDHQLPHVEMAQEILPKKQEREEPEVEVEADTGSEYYSSEEIITTETFQKSETGSLITEVFVTEDGRRVSIGEDIEASVQPEVTSGKVVQTTDDEAKVVREQCQHPEPHKEKTLKDQNLENEPRDLPRNPNLQNIITSYLYLDPDLVVNELIKTTNLALGVETETGNLDASVINGERILEQFIVPKIGNNKIELDGEEAGDGTIIGNTTQSGNAAGGGDRKLSSSPKWYVPLDNDPEAGKRGSIYSYITVSEETAARIEEAAGGARLLDDCRAMRCTEVGIEGEMAGVSEDPRMGIASDLAAGNAMAGTDVVGEMGVVMTQKTSLETKEVIKERAGDKMEGVVKKQIGGVEMGDATKTMREDKEGKNVCILDSGEEITTTIKEKYFCEEIRCAANAEAAFTGEKIKGGAKKRIGDSNSAARVAIEETFGGGEVWRTDFEHEVTMEELEDARNAAGYAVDPKIALGEPFKEEGAIGMEIRDAGKGTGGAANTDVAREATRDAKEEWEDAVDEIVDTNARRGGGGEDTMRSWSTGVGLQEERNQASGWPEHLPKNAHIHNISGVGFIQPASGGRILNIGKSTLPRVDAVWPNHLPHTEHINNISGIDSMKPSTSGVGDAILHQPVLTTTSGVAEKHVTSISPSSTPQQSTAGNGMNAQEVKIPEFPLPNMDRRLTRRRNLRRRQIKSLDSGVHHYYGEYVNVENVGCCEKTKNGKQKQVDIPKEIKEVDVEEIVTVLPNGTIKEEKIIIIEK